MEITCCCSRFFELGATVATMRELADGTEVVKNRQCMKLHETWLQFTKVVNHCGGLIATLSEQGVQTRMQDMLDVGILEFKTHVDKLISRVASSIDTDYTTIHTAASDACFKDFTNATTAGNFENTDCKPLLETCASAPATTLFDTFMVIDALQASVEQTLSKMKEALAGGSTAKTQLEDYIKEWQGKVAAASEGHADMAENAGKLLGHMCLLQAWMRQLVPGETRQGLLSKCSKGLAKKKYLKCEPHMQLILSQAAGQQSKAAGSDAQPKAEPSEVKTEDPEGKHVFS